MQDLNLCYCVSPSATKAKLNLAPLSSPVWPTRPLKVSPGLMSWSLTEEMCLTPRPSCLPPPVMIIIFSYLHCCPPLTAGYSESLWRTYLPSTPIFLSALLCLIPVVRWKPHYFKFGYQGGFRDSTHAAAEGVKCCHTGAAFSLIPGRFFKGVVWFHPDLFQHRQTQCKDVLDYSKILR